MFNCVRETVSEEDTNPSLAAEQGTALFVPWAWLHVPDSKGTETGQNLASTT